MVEQIRVDAVNAIRTLSMDMIDEANSGHPGLPMGAAPMAYVLWANHMKQNPLNSHWTDRDRFILSAGHGSAMLYSMLHLAGFQVTLEDLKNFRQYESKTPGHPEVHYTDGVEATTGPLGQGIANAVGMAMAEAHDAAIYNTENHRIVDHYTYALCGDGDLMEGVSQEAASLAGHLKLDKLIVLYDSNDISLDGPTSKAFTENVGARFEAYGWEHILVEDGNDLEAIDRAITQAKQSDKPSLIEVKTIIGFGAENQGTHKVHGAPLGNEGSQYAKDQYGWKYGRFEISDEIYAHFKEVIQERGKEAEANWQETFNAYQNEQPELAQQFLRAYSSELPKDWDTNLPTYAYGDDAQASRKTSQAAIQAIGEAVPEFWGGSADLSSSNNTMNSADKDFEPGQYEGRNIWYGVREFAMGAAMNGIALHGGSKAYAGTFFVFSDYVRPAIRLAAISQLPVTYVFTHDSIGVGEDGPTHEPIEQLASFRAMHNVNVIRPADGNEVNAAWRIAMHATDRPTLLVLTRQNLPVLEHTQELAANGVEQGAYVVSPAKGDTPEGILIATGSEVALAIEAQKALSEQGHDVQVVSMPSQEIFNAQDDTYKESVLPKAVTKRVAVEMGSSFGWERYVGFEGKVIGIDRFGASGKGEVIQEAYGFTPENVVNTYLSL